MSVKQSTRSNSSLPNCTNTMDGISPTDNATANITPKRKSVMSPPIRLNGGPRYSHVYVNTLVSPSYHDPRYLLKVNSLNRTHVIQPPNQPHSSNDSSENKFIGTILLTVISVSMIVIGSVYLKQCPSGKYIPVYLLVGGLMGLLIPLLSLRGGSRVHSDPSEQTALRHALNANSSKSSSLICCFMLGWFFIGSFWIYEPAYGRDCDKTLYLFAFWLVTTVYLTFAVVLVIIFAIIFIKICTCCIVKLRHTPTETPANV